MSQITLAHKPGEQFLGLFLAVIVPERLALVLGDDLLPQGNFGIKADNLVDGSALREGNHAPVDFLAPLLDEMAPFVPEAELHDGIDGDGYHLQLVTLDTRGGLVVLFEQSRVHGPVKQFLCLGIREEGDKVGKFIRTLVEGFIPVGNQFVRHFGHVLDLRWQRPGTATGKILPDRFRVCQVHQLLEQHRILILLDVFHD